jgi:hypothetical protein
LGIEVKPERPHDRFIGPLPTRGPWTAVGLGSGPFFAILGLSALCFALVPTPVWADPHGEHFWRLTLSYALIPAAVAIALRTERPFPIGRWVAASALLALVKLVVTALLLIGVVAVG